MIEFRRKFWRRYVSPNGFEIRLLPGPSLEYAEGSRRLVVALERLTHPNGAGLYERSLVQWASPDQLPITPAEREQIVHRIQELYVWLGKDLVVTDA